jgi:uncharacterized protein (TIGR02145 family)
MPIFNGLSTQNKKEIIINGVHMCRVYCGNMLVWQKITEVLGGLGLLYNFAALTDVRNIAPEGYRVATLTDILDLIEYLGGEAVAGGDIKALERWTDPNTGATNESGLTALPAGTRNNLGEFAEKLLSSKIWIDNREL